MKWRVRARERVFVVYIWSVTSVVEKILLFMIERCCGVLVIVTAIAMIVYVQSLRKNDIPF